ncbi:glycine cleavage system transcriptional activator [Klebsiella pneumoniae]|uniref:Glycine cleavage system transcriptional activator n=1 Tax=Klebsiella pneumoniae TaxID=573 RepID=A0A377ZA26_KLEPN|nr:glycine cleavage system transcriptional activator [Klebsiella pneumoniae]
MESWNAWCSQAGLEKPIVPSGLRLNDSNLVLEAVRLGAGVALERRSLVAGGDSPRRAGAAHRRHRPLPLALLANRLPAGGEPAGSRPVSSPGWRREIALWRQQISA